VRSVEYDLLSRPVRHKTHDVTRRFGDGSGYVDNTTYDIASRTIYDKNSNVREAIDPNGNRRNCRRAHHVKDSSVERKKGSERKKWSGNFSSVRQVRRRSCRR